MIKASDNQQYWLGDEASLLHHIAIEQKIHDTPTSQLQDMSIRAMTEYAAEKDREDAVEFGGSTLPVLIIPVLAGCSAG